MICTAGFLNFPTRDRSGPRVWSAGLRLQAGVQHKQARIWGQEVQGSLHDLPTFLSTASQPQGLCSVPELPRRKGSRERWSKSGERVRSSPAMFLLRVAACGSGERENCICFVYFFMATHKPSQTQIKMKYMKTFLTFWLRNVTKYVDWIEIESPCHT